MYYEGLIYNFTLFIFYYYYYIIYILLFNLIKVKKYITKIKKHDYLFKIILIIIIY